MSTASSSTQNLLSVPGFGTLSASCTSASGEHYVVQSFKVSLRVAKGDYIAIESRRAGTLSCSGGNGFLLYAPPLPVGGPLKKAQSGASCDLLVQFSYK